MMILTLALSVMAMGSAMANDSMSDIWGGPKKVKIEINHNCCDHPGGFVNGHYVSFPKHAKKNHKFGKGKKHSCCISECRVPAPPHGAPHGGRPGFERRPNHNGNGRPGGPADNGYPGGGHGHRPGRK